MLLQIRRSCSSKPSVSSGPAGLLVKNSSNLPSNMMTGSLFLQVAVAAAVASVLLLGGVSCSPFPTYNAPIPILTDVRSQDDYGGYAFEYSTGNGIGRKEQGRQSYGQTSEGGWSYTSPDGVPVDITFVAGKGGYQPTGAVIPTPPALPYARSQRF
ncbi:endocuticle structural glycoprotein SgAbd-2-like [Eriocheir sinensis]|uniref:endocuticle structural glycoprotein SgAbd-2-like n=1 Tax=Eriocheir sinensis TaxID=95602 RepID=UPI0021C848F0|nr:endocuticle structural glycoprotein SgAbd-2-like [Eriocheir sinensis]